MAKKRKIRTLSLPNLSERPAQHRAARYLLRAVRKRAVRRGDTASLWERLVISSVSSWLAAASLKLDCAPLVEARKIEVGHDLGSSEDSAAPRTELLTVKRCSSARQYCARWRKAWNASRRPPISVTALSISVRPIVNSRQAVRRLPGGAAVRVTSPLRPPLNRGLV